MKLWHTNIAIEEGNDKINRERNFIMPILTKEDILQRGWSQDAFECLAGKSQLTNREKQQGWHLNYIEKIEKTPQFVTFTNREDFYNSTRTENFNKKPIQKSSHVKNLTPSSKQNQFANLTKEDILQRGWSEDAFECLIKLNPKVNQHKAWQLNYIQKVEKSLEFVTFTNSENFQTRDSNFKDISIVPGFETSATVGIELILSLKIDFTTPDYLLSNKESYEPLKPIFHLVKQDFAPEINGSYSLFTDGAYKTMGKEGFACYGGWILNNKTDEVILEFTGPLALKNPMETPQFEIMAIAQGVNLINQLGLKNVQFYTDSSEDAKRLLTALNGHKDKHYQNNAELYEPVLAGLKKSNSSISWIPRDYNSHADELNKVTLQSWLNTIIEPTINNDYITQNGYVVDRTKDIYFQQDKNIYVKPEELPYRHTLIQRAYKTLDNQQYIASVIYDNETNQFSLLQNIKKDFSYLDQSLPKDILANKKGTLNGLMLMNICNTLDLTKDLGNINVSVSHEVGAVVKQLKPIPHLYQEEYFAFHKKLSEYPIDLKLTSLSEKMSSKVQKFLDVEFDLSPKSQPKIKM